MSGEKLECPMEEDCVFPVQEAEKDPKNIFLPSFWDNNERFTKMWFTIAEEEFAKANIVTEQEKFDRVMAGFDQSTLELIRAAVPSESEIPYTEMRRFLLWKVKNNRRKRTNITFEIERRRNVIRKLRSITILGKSPTEFLQQLIRAGGHILEEHYLRAIWQVRLPRKIRISIRHLDLPLEELARHADRLMRVFNDDCAECEHFDNIARSLYQELWELRMRLRQYEN